ncbi:MAG: hypothetical protein U1F77_13720 [Kiritimatiellia bacterium]
MKNELNGKVYVDAWINPYCQSEHMNKLLGEVLDKGPYDVVHINTGLHGWPKGRIKDGTFEPLTKAMIQVIQVKCPEGEDHLGQQHARHHQDPAPRAGWRSIRTSSSRTGWPPG